MSSIRVTLAGVGLHQTLEVEEGSNLELVIGEAGVDPNLVPRVAGSTVARDYVPADGEQVVLTPPDVKLG